MNKRFFKSFHFLDTILFFSLLCSTDVLTKEEAVGIKNDKYFYMINNISKFNMNKHLDNEIKPDKKFKILIFILPYFRHFKELSRRQAV